MSVVAATALLLLPLLNYNQENKNKYVKQAQTPLPRLPRDVFVELHPCVRLDHRHARPLRASRVAHVEDPQCRDDFVGDRVPEYKEL